MARAFALCGSRRPSPALAALVRRVASHLLAAGRPALLGCSLGADATALACLAARPVPGSRVFAVCGPSGEGALPSSAVSAVLSAAAVGVPVSWWSGGSPAVPPRARLAARSLALLRAAAAAGAPLVAFADALPPAPFAGRGPWFSCGSGTWSEIACAAALGSRIFLLGLPPSLVPPALPALGTWAQASLLGLPCWAWAPGLPAPTPAVPAPR